VALDEFALQSVPDTHYAWAPRNTAPTVPGDERNRKKLNGFLGVDPQRGTTDVGFRAQSKTNDAVVMVVLLVLRHVQRGFRWITVILDNATIHGPAMKAAVGELLAEIAEIPAWADLKNINAGKQSRAVYGKGGMFSMPLRSRRRRAGSHGEPARRNEAA
jgi:hypothetical protein